jgi:hypothetical protein
VGITLERSQDLASVPGTLYPAQRGVLLSKPVIALLRAGDDRIRMILADIAFGIDTVANCHVRFRGWTWTWNEHDGTIVLLCNFALPEPVPPHESPAWKELVENAYPDALAKARARAVFEREFSQAIDSALRATEVVSG